MAVRLKVPKTFQLGGVQWSVELVDKISGDDLGECDSTGYKIQLLRSLDHQAMVHTFYHELLHAILDTLGRSKLSKDEELVDAASNLLVQFLKTRRNK
jgi:hypothetical protein